MPYKGQPKKAQILREYPYHVRKVLLDDDRGERAGRMFKMAMGKEYRTVGDGMNEFGDAVIWCFKSKEDADMFRAAFGPDETDPMKRNTR